MKVESDYPVITLGKLAEKIDYGFTASATDIGNGPKFLRITDIQDDHVNWSTVPLCEANEEDTAQYALAEGDIVFARTGATTGKSYLIHNCPHNSIFASYLIRVRPSKDVDPGYLSRFFQTSSYWRQINLNTSGTAQGGVNATKLKTLLVPLPPLEEQRRIAAILDKADGVRRKRKEAIALTEELLRSAFLDMFGDPITNPKGWKAVNLGTLLNFLTSGSRGWAKYYSEQGSLFLRIQNVKAGRLLLEDIAFVSAPDSAEARRTCVQEGDVLVSITADLGRTAVIPRDLGEAYINQHLALLRLDKNCILPTYAAAFLASIGGQIQFDRLNREGVKAGLNFNDLKGLQILLPPLEKQRVYSDFLEVQTNASQHQKASRSESDNLFNSLLQRAFRGEL